jgi:hypothetical protein
MYSPNMYMLSTQHKMKISVGFTQLHLNKNHTTACIYSHMYTLFSWIYNLNNPNTSKSTKAKAESNQASQPSNQLL